MHTAILLLGGNVGDTRQIFQNARQKLEEITDIQKVSVLYQTEAWGMEDANDFLNQAVMLKTSWTAHELLDLIAPIEKAAGRERNLADKAGYQSRKLDIDILLIDDEVINTPDLVVPHPRMHLRKFTLMPLAEIAGDWKHPVLHKSIRELLVNCPDDLSVRKL